MNNHINNNTLKFKRTS